VVPAPTAPDPLAPRLRLAVARLSRRLRQQAAGSAGELSPSGLSALSTVERRGSLSLGELAATERVQPPSMTAIVARLEQRGLLGREVDLEDRRVARVSITPAGRRQLARARTRKDAYLARRLRTLPAAEVELLERAVPVLERLLGDEP
jgi:DNA-binding MarR family transcriptional regulator